MSDYPRVGVGVFVWKGDKFLMGQRLGSHGANTWSVPGGHLEFGESWEEAALREVVEETGVKAGNPRFVAVTNDIFHEENKHYVTIWVFTDWISGEPTLTEPDKWINQEWRTLESMPTPLFLTLQNLLSTRADLFQDSVLD
jgi:8-oxo-dGTP diphosphatase